MKLAKPDLIEILNRCTTVYRLPKGVEVTVLADEWYRQLRQFEAEDVIAAVEAYLSSEARFFPLPGTIKKLAYEARRSRGPDPADLATKYWRWAQAGMNGPCPVCEAVLACLKCGTVMVGAPPCNCGARFGVQHDHERHLNLKVGYTGPRSPLAAVRTL